MGYDVDYFGDLSVPTFNFVAANDKYYWYHHAESETMTAMDSDELDQCLAVYAPSVYVVADLRNNLAGRSPGPDTNAGTLTPVTIFPFILVAIVVF